MKKKMRVWITRGGRGSGCYGEVGIWESKPFDMKSMTSCRDDCYMAWGDDENEYEPIACFYEACNFKQMFGFTPIIGSCGEYDLSISIAPAHGSSPSTKTTRKKETKEGIDERWEILDL